MFMLVSTHLAKVDAAIENNDASWKKATEAREDVIRSLRSAVTKAEDETGAVRAKLEKAEDALAACRKLANGLTAKITADEPLVAAGRAAKRRETAKEALIEAEFEREMDATSRVYGLRPGYMLTQDDYDAIQLYDKVSRRDQDNNTIAFNKGYQCGLRDGGSADISEMDSRLSKMIVEKGVEKMMRVLSDQRADEILAALVGVMDILGHAESNASGNPEWDHVGPHVEAARAIVEQYAPTKEPVA